MISARSGVRLLMLLGPAVPRPAGLEISTALERVEVLEPEEGPAGFQLLFRAGRGFGARTDDLIVSGAQLAPFSRVVLVLQGGLGTSVLVDGVITHRQVVRAGRTEPAAVAVTGQDLTLLMDLEERVTAHPALSDPAIAAVLIGAYAGYGIVPQIVPPAVVDQPLPIQRVPVQHGTDLAHLRLMAARAHHVFTLRPGPVPLTSVAYWGPAAGLVGPTLPALSVGTGGPADVTSIVLEEDALAPLKVTGRVIDASTGRVVPLEAPPSPVSVLARSPVPARRTALLGSASGLTAGAALTRAQARADTSTDEAVAVSGELDVARYGAPLRPHRLVGLRGVGASFDGLYRVREVTHVLERGGYRQRFRLGRPGTGTTAPAVPTTAIGG